VAVSVELPFTFPKPRLPPPKDGFGAPRIPVSVTLLRVVVPPLTVVSFRNALLTPITTGFSVTVIVQNAPFVARIPAALAQLFVSV
jgi:hypothetical protein